MDINSAFSSLFAFSWSSSKSKPCLAATLSHFLSISVSFAPRFARSLLSLIVPLSKSLVTSTAMFSVLSTPSISWFCLNASLISLLESFNFWDIISRLSSSAIAFAKASFLPRIGLPPCPIIAPKNSASDILIDALGNLLTNSLPEVLPAFCVPVVSLSIFWPCQLLV